ncbi:MAG: hypothetical protein FJX75_07020 [Armatimonadetes bacterium]|nr:hypothetical protein [Armatimonadota bacterium]
MRRLLFLCTLAVLSLLMGQSLLAPLAVGWRRAEKTLALQDELADLQRQHVVVREEIEYRKTPAGQALTAAEVLAMTYPHGRVVDLVPRSDDAKPVAPSSLGERVKGWREKGRTCLRCKWRVLNLLLLDRRLPPDRAPQRI